MVRCPKASPRGLTGMATAGMDAMAMVAGEATAGIGVRMAEDITATDVAGMAAIA